MTPDLGYYQLLVTSIILTGYGCSIHTEAMVFPSRIVADLAYNKINVDKEEFRDRGVYQWAIKLYPEAGDA